MCTVFLAAVRRALPQARVAAGLFHVVQLAVKAPGDVRRRATRDKYGRRGKKGDPEYGLKGLLGRNLENLSREKFEKVIDTLDADGHGQQVLLAWIAKEKLRDVLNLRARVTGSAPCERQVRDRLFTFYDWCTKNDAVPELAVLAGTVSRWEDEIVTAVLTGVTKHHVGEPQPHRQARSPPRLRLPQPREPAQPRPHRLHPRNPATVTHRNQHAEATRNQPKAGSRLTSKSRLTMGAILPYRNR